MFFKSLPLKEHALSQRCKAPFFSEDLLTFQDIFCFCFSSWAPPIALTPPLTSCLLKAKQLQPCLCLVCAGMRSSVRLHVRPAAVHLRGLCQRQLLLPDPQLRGSSSARYAAGQPKVQKLCTGSDSISKDKRLSSTRQSGTTQDPAHPPFIEQAYTKVLLNVNLSATPSLLPPPIP